jgi:hypothetical protein
LTSGNFDDIRRRDPPRSAAIRRDPPRSAAIRRDPPQGTGNFD